MTKGRTLPANARIGTWREIDGELFYFRSEWERKYALYLEWLKRTKNITEWLYEPKTFWFEGIKRGCVSYKPDFQVILASGSHYWVEVKGYMDSKSKTKLDRFKRYFPNESLEVIDGNWFRRNSRKLKGLVPGWE